MINNTMMSPINIIMISDSPILTPCMVMVSILCVPDLNFFKV